jgi:hypothetical protein
MPHIWRQIPGLVWNDHRSASQKVRRFGIFIGLTLGGALGRVCLLLDKLFDRECDRVEIREPVFIVGNARSGTTLLHRLLTGDEERFVTFKGWELFCPSLLQKRAVRFAVEALRYVSPKLLERMAEWEARQMPDLKRLNPLGINETQEDELLLIQYFATPGLAVAFPYMQELNELEYFDDLPSEHQDAVLSLYRECVTRQLAFHDERREGLTFLSKNPAFVGKLRALLEQFPDARFIYPRRDPLESLPSILAMLREAWKLTNFDEREMELASQAVIDGCIKDYFYATEVLEELPADRFAVVEFEAFTADPARTVRGIYRHFGWTLDEDYGRWLTEAAPKPDSSIPTRRRRLEDFGFDEDVIAARIASAASNAGAPTQPNQEPDPTTR